MVQRLFIDNFTPGVAQQPAQDDKGQQRPLGEIWMELLLQDFDDWFALADKQLFAAQVGWLCKAHAQYLVPM